MSYRRYRFIALALLLASAGCSTKFDVRQPHMRLVLRANPGTTVAWPRSKAAQRSVMRDAGDVLQRRARGAGNAQVTPQGSDKLVFTMSPIPADKGKFIQGLISSGLLEFYWGRDLQGSNNPMGKWVMNSPPKGTGAYVFSDPKGKRIDSSKDPKAVLSEVFDYQHNPPVLTGKDVMPTARASMDRYGRATVSIQFTNAGTAIFRDFTSKHVGDYLAIFFNGRLLTVPVINEAIPSGRAEISGFRNLDEARTAADVLNARALPVPLKVMSKTITR